MFRCERSSRGWHNNIIFANPNDLTSLDSFLLGQTCPLELLQVQTKRQDKLLFVGLHVLINLAEEVSTERKMVRPSLTREETRR